MAAALALLSALFVGACDSGTPDGPERPLIEFDRQSMLHNLGENIVLPVYRVFDTEANALATGVTDYCAALGTEDEAVRLDEARARWRAAMDAWQMAEMMLFGPAAMDANTLRDRIYAWPVTSSCAVDQGVMLRYQDSAGYDVSAQLTNRRGLDALEYLLFAPDLDTTCAVLIAPAGWDELEDDVKRDARCRYAEAAAFDLVEQAAIARDAWEPDRGNYLAELSNAGDRDTFASAHEAVNVVSNAMFYSDSEVKDMKLGQPAGIVINACNAVQEPCTSELESAFARRSKENVVANLRGFDMMFRGYGPGQSPDDATGLGFDDFLRAAGADELADTMIADIENALAAAQAIPGSLSEALAGDYQSVVDAHTSVKTVTDNLKSQFLTILGLDIPNSAAGDND